MLPGVDFTEMLLLAVLAMVLLGPRDLPLMMRKIGRFTGKMRALAFEFKQGFDELGRQAELEELRKEVADLKKNTGLEDLQKDFEQDRINLQKDIDSAMAPSGPALPNAAANGASADPPAAASHAGLSPDHPGYDTGENAAADAGNDAGGDSHASQAADPAPEAPSAEKPVAAAKQDANA